MRDQRQATRRVVEKLSRPVVVVWAPLPPATPPPTRSFVPLLSLVDVHRTYDNGVHALRGISLEIGPGLFGLLGPNGAGKSSLMRTIATLQHPDRGTVSLDGQNVFDDVASHRARLGYLPQDFGVYPGLSALALLDHLAVLKGLTQRAQRREQVHALLHQVNLWENRHRAVSGFSGGRTTRVNHHRAARVPFDHR